MQRLAIWVTYTCDHSAMLKAYVQEWFRVNVDGNTTREDSKSGPPFTKKLAKQNTWSEPS